jgi:hypothetical protein
LKALTTAVGIFNKPPILGAESTPSEDKVEMTYPYWRRQAFQVLRPDWDRLSVIQSRVVGLPLLALAKPMFLEQLKERAFFPVIGPVRKRLRWAVPYRLDEPLSRFVPW